MMTPLRPVSSCKINIIILVISHCHELINLAACYISFRHVQCRNSLLPRASLCFIRVYRALSEQLGLYKFKLCTSNRVKPLESPPPRDFQLSADRNKSRFKRTHLLLNTLFPTWMLMSVISVVGGCFMFYYIFFIRYRITYSTTPTRTENDT